MSMKSGHGTKLVTGMTGAAPLGPAEDSVPSPDFPQAEITNGQVLVKLYLPDAKMGFYRATRFDWSGVVASLVFGGHEYYGRWFDRVDPNIHDFGYEGTMVVASPCAAITGPVEEFQTNGTALGWDEAEIGGNFIKIGVGVLRRDSGDYDMVKLYEISDPGKWTVKTRRDAVEFTHELRDPASGYGYDYRKTVRLAEGRPEMVLEHSLKNTGSRRIESAVYNHNFLVLDKQAPGPDFTITVPFRIQTPDTLNRELAEIRGNKIVFMKTLEKEDCVQTAVRGFSNSPMDNEIRVENRKVGAGVRITGDRPLSNGYLWSIRTVLSMEPFITMAIDQGEQFTWKSTYEYYTLSACAN